MTTSVDTSLENLASVSSDIQVATEEAGMTYSGLQSAASTIRSLSNGIVRSVNSVSPDENGNVDVEIPDTDVPRSGSRGSLAGYNTPASSSSAITITASSNDDTIITAAVAITVADGTSGQTWIKTVAIQNASSTVSLGSAWAWVGGSAPTISANSILVLKWCGTFGIANLATSA